MTAPHSAASVPATQAAIAIFALSLGGFAIGISEFATMSVLPFFSAEYGVTEPEAGAAISAYALGVCVGAPVLAAMAARMDRRLLLVLLMALYAVSNGMGGLAADFDDFVLTRFISGFPHGAYLGVAALTAARITGPQRRGIAVALVLLGITAATIIGVPLANLVAQSAGWRWTFAMAAVAAGASAAMILFCTPKVAADEGASPLRELGALARPQVLLTLAVGAIGFGGLFAVYTYAGSALMLHAGASAAALPWLLAVFGFGMAAGGLFFGWLADKALTPAVFGALGLSVVGCLFYAAVAHDVWLSGAAVFVVGAGGGLSALLQTRLMNVAGDAQTLAAAMNHTAFNAANALGPFAAGIALEAGYGWPSVGVVGAGLAALGALAMVITLLAEKAPRAERAFAAE